MDIMNARGRLYRRGSARQPPTERPAVRGEGDFAHCQSRPPLRQGSKLFKPRAWTAISRSLHLSTREQQLLRGVLDDWTDASIASALGISPHTVHTHFERLHQKLGVPNRARLILRVVDEFLALTASPGSSLPPICPNRNRCGCLLRHRSAAA